MGESHEDSLLINEDANYQSIRNDVEMGRRTRRNVMKGFLRQLSPGDFVMLFFGTIGSAMNGAVPLLFYYFFGSLISHATGSKEDLYEAIWRTAYWYCGLALLAGVGMWLQRAMFSPLGLRISQRVRRNYFRALMENDIAYFDATPTGDILQRIGDDASTISTLFSGRLGMIVMGILQAVGGVAVAAWKSWELTLFMVGSVPVMVVLIAIMGNVTVFFTKALSKRSAVAKGVAEEVVTGIRTVRAFANEEREAARYGRAVTAELRMGYLQGVATGASEGTFGLVLWGAVAASFYFGGWLLKWGRLDLADLVTVFGLNLFAVIGVSSALAILPEIFKTRAAFGLIRAGVRDDPAVCDGPREVGTAAQGEIELRNVTFCYPSRPDVNVLRNVSLTARKGQVVALVGSSGSGKSSTLNLIERFYDPSAGQILFDGVDVRDLSLGSLRRSVAVVSQEPILFSDTILENIRYGRANASLDEVIDVARKANAHDFIMSQPDGYNTQVGERGTQLSGGQKQRVAIARAMLCDPALLLLDEATSSLDAESESLVQAALETLMVGRTTLVVAHRLSTIRGADRILVFQSGAIVEEGTHDELIDKKGFYAALVHNQM